VKAKHFVLLFATFLVKREREKIDRERKRDNKRVCERNINRERVR
jgi:hypothetical protein